MFGLIGFVYLAFSALMILPALYLYRTAVNYQQFVNTENSLDLELALEQQKNFWRFIGIMYAIVLGIYALFFLIGLLASLAR